MSIQIKSLACPQCGAGQCAKVDGTPNLYACKNCGAEFVLSDNNAPKEMRVIHSMDAGQFDSLKNLKYIALAIAGAALLVLVLPMIWSAIARFKPAQPDLGRLQASTVYEAPAGQFNVVRVMEKDDGRNQYAEGAWRRAATQRRTRNRPAAQPFRPRARAVPARRGTGGRWFPS